MMIKKLWKTKHLLLSSGLLLVSPLSTDSAKAENPIDVPAGGGTVVINNQNGSEIASADTAISVAGNAIIRNSGEIAGGINGVNFVNGQGSGVLTNTATGIISSDSRAVNIGGRVAVTNLGTIVGTGDQRNGTVYSDGVANNFSIVNRGTIDAGEGNQGSGVALEIEQTRARVVNSGVIQGRTNTPGIAGNSGLSGDGLRLANFAPLEGDEERFFRGSIINSGDILSESLSGPIAGFRVGDGVGFQGLLNNSGLISGPNNGAYFGNGNHLRGRVINSGRIESDSRAFNIDGSNLRIDNRGEIVGTGNQRNGTVYADSTAQNFVLNNRGQGIIDAGEGNLGAGFSVELSESGNDFDINNFGSIVGRGNAGAGAATAGDGIRLERTRVGGALDGTTTGLYTGIINNIGTITSEGANGTVGGFRAVNGVSFQGRLNNRGTIAGVQNGVYFGNPTPAGGGDHTGGIVNNFGTISSDSRAFNIDGLGLAVNNLGSIIGTGDQRNGTVYADSTAQNFVLNNRGQGVIDAGEDNLGAGFSVELSEAGNDFRINNFGQINGRGNAGAGAATAGDGIRLERARVEGALDGSTTGLFTGTIRNSGIITSEGANGTVGGFRAVNGVSFQGRLINSGTISGVQNGVYFGNPVPAGGGDHTGGVVINSGTISSDSRAFNLDGIGLTVLNRGDIVATGRQRNGTFYLDGTATEFRVTNQRNATIDARGGAGSGLSFQVGTSATSVQTGSITNFGLIAGAGDQPVDAGVRLFAPTAGATFEGNIVNQAGATISAETAPAVLIEAGVNFDGTFVNNGTIDGGISIASGALRLGSQSVVSLDITDDTNFEAIDVLGDVRLGGVLDLSFEHGTATAPGLTYDLLDFVSLTGDIEIRTNGVSLDTSNFLVDGTVSILGTLAASFAAVPEPSTMAMLLCGSFAGLVRRRR